MNTEQAKAFARDTFAVSRETLTRVEIVLNVLDIWRQKINLIGPKEWEHIWSRHVLDSLQLTPMIPADAQVVDLGSGAGFPGLMLACAVENGHVTMIESIRKKCTFLQAAIDTAILPATVHNGRVEEAPTIKADYVTARAFAPLPKLLDYAAPWLEAGAIGLFHKGERWEEELTAAQEKWTLAYEAIPSRMGGSGVILKILEARHAR